MALFVSIGIWTAIPALHAGETWIHHVIVHHPGLVAFLILDAIVLISGTTLTTAQAFQVNEEFIHQLLTFPKLFEGFKAG